MRLLLDIGNTRMKWALSEGTVLSGLGAAEHHGDPAATFGSLDWPKASAVAIASVMGAEPDGRLAKAIGARLGHAPDFAQVVAEKNGLRVAYAQPQRLGVDRWLAMLALWSERRAAFCIASAGTALTFDAVDANGRHLGGVIAPGLEAMQKTTLGATRFSTRGLSVAYTDALGTDTESCVRQGALHAVAGLIERLCARHDGARILCGGDANTLLPHLSAGWQQRPHLVLEGLLTLQRTPPA